MNITRLNFVPGHVMQITILSSVLLMAGMLLGVLGIYTVHHAEAHINKMTPLEKRIAELRVEQAKQQELLLDSPSPSDVENLSERITILSNKLDLQGIWISDLFYELEAAFPDQAYLIQFHYPFESDIARIFVHADSENILSKTLKRMEKSDRISNVVLAGLSREEDGLQTVVADVRFSLQGSNQ
ncbi:MAG: hypothetical protein N0E54_00605 [Candidatus Thiodiazotropha taylori]|nr:hypothetical protein [Candidatus Thiodiazotropha endolucinida]MCW4227217.1 hypothetical protein [Candidatus Thiodiazotropha taylori]